MSFHVISKIMGKHMLVKTQVGNTWWISEGHSWMILVVDKFNLGFYYAFCDIVGKKGHTPPPSLS